jgi:hypothetical protein
MDYVPERYVHSRCCGSLWYTVDAEGRLQGSYPEMKGRLVGRVDATGTATGLWFQPRSDRLCARTRGGTRTWGRFVLHDVGSNGMTGAWGYCDDEPDHDWGFE